MDISENFKDLFEFVETHKDKDPYQLRLSADSSFKTVDKELAITQIECRKKYQVKFKELVANPRFLFPDPLSCEQASHSAIAHFHASLAKSESTLLDMTSGLGIDSMAFAKKGIYVLAIDIDPNRSSILKYNSEILCLKSLQVLNFDSVEYLKSSTAKFDLIFIDPSRRDDSNNRLYDLHDCQPNLFFHIELLKQRGGRILIKASPMLDISQTLRCFNDISSIKVIGIKGECKEVLIEIIPSTPNPPIIEAINLDNEGNVISKFSSSFPLINDKNTILFASINEIKTGAYILEPSAMIMKIAPWSLICDNFNAKKFAQSSHLFITDKLPEEFPGRVTVIKRILAKKDRKSLVGLPATCISRNHPISSESLRKDLKLKEGDQNFIYASRVGNKPILIHTLPI